MPAILEVGLHASRRVVPTIRNLHALACAIFEGPGAPHTGQTKPFTVWPLRPGRQIQDAEDHAWVLRAAWLDRVSPPLPDVGAKLDVGPVPCAITSLVCRTTSHVDIADGPTPARVRLGFRTPTFFAHNGGHTLGPEPRLIIGSYRRQWNTWLPAGDPLAIADDTWSDMSRNIRLTDYTLRTEKMDSGHGRTRTGFTGVATLHLDPATSSTARAAFGLLGRFATYCGTGAQTTHGFGATTVAFPGIHGRGASHG